MGAQDNGDTRVRRRITTVIRGDGVTAVNTYSSKNADIKFCDKHYISVARFGTVTTGVFSVRAKPVVEPPIANAAAMKAALIGIEGIDFTKVNNLAWEVSGFFDAFELAITTVVGGGGSISLIINSVNTNG